MIKEVFVVMIYPCLDDGCWTAAIYSTMELALKCKARIDANRSRFVDNNYEWDTEWGEEPTLIDGDACIIRHTILTDEIPTSCKGCSYYSPFGDRATGIEVNTRIDDEPCVGCKNPNKKGQQ